MSRSPSSDPPRKIGQGSFAAWLRQGHKEIGRLFNAVEEPGQIGTATPLAVSIQTGVSPQPRTTQELRKMSATEPYDVPSAEPILDNLIEQAAEMPQPEIEQEIER